MPPHNTAHQHQPVLQTPVWLQTNFTTIGVKPCVLGFNPVNDNVTLRPVDGLTQYFQTPVQRITKLVNSKLSTRLTLTVDGTKYRLLFEKPSTSRKRALASSAGTSAAGGVAGAVAGAVAVGVLKASMSRIDNSDLVAYAQWVALFKQHGKL